MIFQTPPVTNIRQYLEGHPWLDISDINVVIPGLIQLILIVAAIVFFILLLFAGIQWMTAGGDKEALSSAKKRLTSALIGIVIVFSAWAILNLVKYFFGLTTLESSSCGSLSSPCGEADLPPCCQGFYCAEDVCTPIGIFP